MPNLADSLQCRQFVEKLEACEKTQAHLTNWEVEFIRDMRESFNSREDAIDLGCNPWNPSANQYNTLCEIFDKVNGREWKS